MIKRQFLFITSLFLGIALVLPAAPIAKADPLASITEYAIPGNTNDGGGIVEGADGNLWFVETIQKSIVVMSKSGVFLNRYSLPSDVTYADSISRGHDGNIWFTAIGYIGSMRFGKITPAGVMSTYTFADGYGGRASNIVSGPDGYMYAGTSNTGIDDIYIQKLDPATGSLIWAMPTSILPTELAVDYVNGLVWYASRNSGKVGRVDPSGNEVQYSIPAGFGNVSSITIGPDGKLWLSNQTGKVVNVSLSGTFSSFYSLGTSKSGTIRSGMDGNLWVATGTSRALVRVTTSGVASVFWMPGNWLQPVGLAAGSDGNIWFTDRDKKKLVKFGTGVSSTSTDTDGDGLNLGQELIQGTSDLIADTDRDGLSDYIESTSYPDRYDVFCGSSCAYPNPTMKDLYVEIDWMENGSFSTKPTSGDLAGAALAYGNKGVKVHFDTGNFGGGNEVDYANVVKGEPDDTVRDFYDYKLGGDGMSAQFSSDRYHIWRYMLSADEITNHDNETDLLGLGIPGDDDTLLAYGSLSASYSGSALEDETGQTIIHEIGHNLCLSSAVAYIGQDSSCVYEHIDSASAPATYASAMKYNGTVLDLSTGINISSGDHDDWSAVLNKGFDDFNLSDQGDEEHNLLNAQSRGIDKKASKRLFASTKARQ